MVCYKKDFLFSRFYGMAKAAGVVIDNSSSWDLQTRSLSIPEISHSKFTWPDSIISAFFSYAESPILWMWVPRLSKIILWRKQSCKFLIIQIIIIWPSTIHFPSLAYQIIWDFFNLQSILQKSYISIFPSGKIYWIVNKLFTI